MATTDYRLTMQQAEEMRVRLDLVAERMRLAVQSGDWPVTVVVDSGLTLSWIGQPTIPPTREDDNDPLD